MTRLVFVVVAEGENDPVLYDETERALALLAERLDRHRIKVEWRIDSAEQTGGTEP